MTIEINKQYKTRDGMAVRILATDAKGRFPIVGLVDVGNAEYARHWKADGRADLRPNVTTNYDLMDEEGDMI